MPQRPLFRDDMWVRANAALAHAQRSTAAEHRSIIRPTPRRLTKQPPVAGSVAMLTASPLAD